MEELCDSIFPDVESLAATPSALASRVILAPTNAVVDTINEKMMSRLPGEGTRYR